jgi:hypothetical protein
MSDRIQPDGFSIGINIGETEYLFDPHYDSVHVFDWLGHGLLKIICEEGLAQIHTSQADAEEVAVRSGADVHYRKHIGQREYDKYLEFMAKTMDDWEV